MNRTFLVSLFCGCLGITLPAAEPSVRSTAEPISQVVNQAAGELQWSYRGKPLLIYAFAQTQIKPYVRELYTLRGENVLRDAPADHPHHHGLMYAVHVNGINFWEEQSEPGVEKSIRLEPGTPGRNFNGQPEAAFTQWIHWVAFTNRMVVNSTAVALLIEERTLTLTVDERAGEVALVWEAQFELGTNTPQVQLRGANYNGLGLRLPEAFNKVAQFANSEGVAYTGDNTQNVIPARWTSASGMMANQNIMLALFGPNANANDRARFFTMTEPFAYLAVTQGLNQKPLEYRGGDRFRLRYLLTVYSENQSREFIARRAETWSKP